MKIEKDTAVTLRYKISDVAGKVLDQSEEPVAYLHGGYGSIFPKVEKELEGQDLGFKKVVELAPQDAFGVRDEDLLQTIPKAQFPPGVKVGGQLEGRGPDGQPRVFTVLKIKGDQVFLDGNHAFAGKTLRFALEVIDVRAASAEEIAHGHVHGAHGHHH
jgi:FKBP-type peptidyl-prolyl cis-trans isomerase SlyD